MWEILKQDRWTPWLAVGAGLSVTLPFFLLLNAGSRAHGAHVLYEALLLLLTFGGFYASWRLARTRRRAQHASEKRSTFLNSLIDNSPLAIVVLDSQGNVRITNPAFEKLFQYSTVEALGQRLDDLILTPEVLDEGHRITERVLDGASLQVTTRRYRKDGMPVDVEFHGVPLVIEGELVGIFALYQDISERRAAEHARSESEERFRRLAGATFEGIVILDGGRIADANEQFYRMVGARVGEVIGESFLDFVEEEDRPLAREKLMTFDARPFELQARRLDGSSFFVEVHSKAMPHQGRQAQVTAVRDISRNKRLEEEARQAQKMEAVGRLAGGIAHDFNNLLTVILGRTAILGKRLRAASSLSHVDEIRRAAEQASMMTQRLLAFGRKQATTAEVIDLNEVLRGMEKMLRRLVRADIDLRFDLSEKLGRVKADPGQIEQVVLNLVINAGDAMPAGGKLLIETSSMDLDDTGPHWSLDGSLGPQVLLEVSDNGTGMDAETRDRAFEPFFTTKGAGKGTGLGLATVYAIVHQNRGSILLESAPGRGTTFRIFLPQVYDLPDSGSEGPLMTAETTALQGSETILVVEDEPAVRRLATDFLSLHGYNVLGAEDGKRGLASFRDVADDVDLVLTDVVMPGLNGPEMVRRIREIRPAVKVLFMSGYDDGILERHDFVESVPLIPKPFSIDELVGQVRQVLDDEEGEETI